MRTRASHILSQLDEWAASTRMTSGLEGLGSAVVHHNPGPSRIAALVNNASAETNGGVQTKVVRILHNPEDNSVHLWDGNKLTHEDVAKELGIRRGSRYELNVDSHGRRYIQKGMKEDLPKLYADVVAGLSKQYPKERSLPDYWRG